MSVFDLISGRFRRGGFGASRTPTSKAIDDTQTKYASQLLAGQKTAGRYFHVKISLRNRVESEIEHDLTREQLDLKYLHPYRQGRPIVTHGRTIQPSEIRRIRIVSTVNTHDELHAASDIKHRGEGATGLYVGPIGWTLLEGCGLELTNDLITGAPGSEAAPRTQTAKTPLSNRDPRKVFVVHGRNDKARNALFAFLRAIGLQPIEWSQAVNDTGKGTPYVGEVLDVAFSTAQAIVVLFTPDDEARLREPFRQLHDPEYETLLTPQARPNVLFEAGMAMGRDSDRTVLVELGELRQFSDIAGRHVIRLTDTVGRRQELAQRLRRAQCDVNLDGIDWHSAGDFAGALK